MTPVTEVLEVEWDRISQIVKCISSLKIVIPMLIIDQKN